MAAANTEAIDFMRPQFARLHAKLDQFGADLVNPKTRMSSLEAEAGRVRIGLAKVNSRMDRVGTRIKCIERRLDLKESV